MKTLGVDIETYSSVSIRDCGMYRYSEDKDFEILLFAFSVDGGEVSIVDLASGEQIPIEVLDALYDDKVIKTSYNAQFEITCISKHLGEAIPVTGWVCTMVKAAMIGLPFGLEKVADVMKLAVRKDKEGRQLIKYFCIPCKPTKVNGMRTRNLPEHDPVKWEAFKKYCIHDVLVEQLIVKKLEFFEPSAFEKPMWALDLKINDRGILIDQQLINNAISLYDTYTDRISEEAISITGISNPKSVQQLKEWISTEIDEEVSNLKKDYIPELLKKVESDQVRRVLTIRQELSKTSVKKYAKMLMGVCADGRLRGLVQYYGANKTGRWAGRMVQVQNLPKNTIPDEDLTLARELVKDGDLDMLEMAFGNVPAILSQLIRTAFVPSPGNKLLVSDFAAIEARVLAWLAGEKWRLDVFNTHGLIYEASGAAMFKVPIEAVNKKSTYRPKAKIAELALGYQGGKGALLKMGAIAMGLTEEELPDIVALWRAANKNIVQYWYDINEAAIECVDLGVPVKHGYVTFSMNKNILHIILPSGRKLSYLRPQLRPNKFDHLALTYECMDQKTKKWGRVETYGGMIVENITQAIARDLLAAKMLTIDQANFNICMHVHDEVVLDESPNISFLKVINDFMGAPISWAPGLPLQGDGFETLYYKKD